MKKTVIIIIIAAVVVGGIIWIVMAQKNNSGGGGYGGGTPSTGSDIPNNGSGNANVTPVAIDKVMIQNFAFTPQSISVKKGTTVTWTNKDSTAHTVTGDGSGGPDSGTLNNGDTYTFTFNTTGTFTYHCNFHSSMTGKVVVTD